MNKILDNKITFKQLVLEDLLLLHQWLQEKHVREFWDDGNRTVEQVKNYYFVDNGVLRYIIYINETPIGFIQSYDLVLNDSFIAYKHPTKPTVGVDFFIGAVSHVGKGYAVAILQSFIKKHCKEYGRVTVDPMTNNLKAIHIYEKAGFNFLGTFANDQQTYYIMGFDT